MLIKQVTVQGYQSLYDVTVQCGRFTVIYGESDVGKSAFYRAIRALITAEIGDSFISHGKKTVRVDLLLDDGTEIFWKKSKGRTPDYGLDEILFPRSRGVPKQISDKLNIRPIVIDKERFYPNLRGQFDSLFMLFESSGKRARLLGSLVSNILLLCIKATNLERYRNDADIRAMRALWEDLNKRSFFDADSFLSKVSASQRILEEIKEDSKKFITLGTLLRRRDELSKYDRLEVEFRPKEDFEFLDKATDLWSRFMLLSAKRLQLTEALKSMEKGCERYILDIAVGQREMKELAQQMKFKCPHCGGEISLLDVEK